LLTSEHPDIEADQEQKRRKRYEQVGKNPTLLDERSCAHRGAAVRQLGEEIVTREGRSLGDELLIRSILLAGKWRWLSELAFNGVPARKQLGHVLAADLILELGVRNELWSGQLILDRKNAEEHQIPD
jgi:hypothetical protein